MGGSPNWTLAALPPHPPPSPPPSNMILIVPPIMLIDGYGHILGMLSVWLNGSEEEEEEEEEEEVGLPLQGGKWDGG